MRLQFLARFLRLLFLGGFFFVCSPHCPNRRSPFRCVRIRFHIVSNVFALPISLKFKLTLFFRFTFNIFFLLLLGSCAGAPARIAKSPTRWRSSASLSFGFARRAAVLVKRSLRTSRFGVYTGHEYGLRNNPEFMMHMCLPCEAKVVQIYSPATLATLKF